MMFPREPLKQNGTPPTGAVGLNDGPSRAIGGLTVKIPARLFGVEYARVEVLTKRSSVAVIAIVRNFLIQSSKSRIVY